MNIGEASKSSGVSAKMIPAAGRTVAGYRVYTMTDVQLLRFIRRARDLGFSVEKIEDLLALWQDRSRQSADVKQIALEQIAGLEVRIREMQAMMDTLRHLADACCGDHRPDCPILADLVNGPDQGSSGREEDQQSAPRSGNAAGLQAH
jgi:Cu(I)-responsive transcriptional regulator